MPKRVYHYFTEEQRTAVVSRKFREIGWDDESGKYCIAGGLTRVEVSPGIYNKKSGIIFQVISFGDGLEDSVVEALEEIGAVKVNSEDAKGLSRQ